MPLGLGFQRKHRFLGYKLKYMYYFIARRDILQRKETYGDQNKDEVIYVIKPDYQDGVEGLLSLIFRQVLYIDHAIKEGYVPFVDWKNFKTQYYDGKNNAWNYFFQPVSNISEEEVYTSKNVYLSGWTFNDINSKGLFEEEIFFDKRIEKQSYELLIYFLVMM
jgi:hypothetical protein